MEQTVSMKYNCQQALYYSYVMYVMKYYENTLIKCKVYVAKWKFYGMILIHLQ